MATLAPGVRGPLSDEDAWPSCSVGAVFVGWLEPSVLWPPVGEGLSSVMRVSVFDAEAVREWLLLLLWLDFVRDVLVWLDFEDDFFVVEVGREELELVE